jgi:hypothetical protein
MTLNRSASDDDHLTLRLAGLSGCGRSGVETRVADFVMK